VLLVFRRRAALLKVYGAAQKREIVRTSFFSGTAGVGDTLPPAEGWSFVVYFKIIFL
jgi:hypothetical protein